MANRRPTAPPYPVGSSGPLPTPRAASTVEPPSGVPNGSPSMRHGPFQHAEDMEPAVAADARRAEGPVPAIQPELLAGDQAADPRSVGRLRPLRLDRPALEIDRSRPCSTCKGRGLPSGPRRFQSKRRKVRSLDCWISATSSPWPRAWTVPAGRKTQSPGRGLEAVQQLLARSPGGWRRPRLPVHARLQAGVDRAARLGGQDDPGLGLAQVGRIEPGGLGVVGMDLDGERPGRVEEFHQQREMRPADDGGPTSSRPCSATSSPSVVPASGPAYDDALVRRRDRRFPSSRRNRRRGRAACPGGFQAAVFPRDSGGRGAETQRIERVHGAVSVGATGAFVARGTP